MVLRMRVFELPEINSLIATFLDHIDLTRCTRVCKVWYATFIPAIWHTIDLCFNLRGPLNPSLESLHKHSYYIRSLTFKDKIPDPYEDLYCPNLRTLCFRMAQPMSYYVIKKECGRETALIRAHPTIKVLALHSIHVLDTEKFWAAVRGLQQLERLTIYNMLTRVENLPRSPKVEIKIIPREIVSRS
ncbi:hypothetical protein BGZ82_000011 [Podila clonocystis]|nr:hypothetical protein BGZ82_000011 [Podila clonocystis]